MNRPTYHRRSGWSLVELLCVISVLAVIMGIITTFLSSTSKFSANMRSQMQLQETAARLADQFREDVRMAARVTFENDTATLESLDATIAYRNTDKGVTRDATAAAERIARDGYWLPDDWRASWKQDSQLVTLTLTSQENQSDAIVIQANLSGDLSAENLSEEHLSTENSNTVTSP